MQISRNAIACNSAKSVMRLNNNNNNDNNLDSKLNVLRNANKLFTVFVNFVIFTLAEVTNAALIMRFMACQINY